MSSPVQHVLAHLDFGGLGELRNAVLGAAATRPESPAVGAVFFNSTSGRVEYWDGSAWQTLAAEVFTEAAHDLHDHSAVASTIALNEIGLPTGNVSLDGNRVVSVGSPVDAGDATNKGYVDSEISTAVAAEAGLREAADTALDTRLTAVESDIAALDSTYATDAEVTAAVAVETARAEAAEAALQAQRDADIALVTDNLNGLVGADTALDARLTTVEGQLTDLDNSFATDAEVAAAVATEAGAREAADTALDTRITAIESAPYAAKSVFTVGDGTATSFTLTHNKGDDVVVQVKDASTGAVVLAGITQGTDTVTVDFVSAPASNAIKVVVIG